MAPRARSSSQLRHSSSQPSLAQQQQQQLQDIKPGLLAQSLSYRQKYTYKDKFHSLRDRYDQVSTANEALQKELATAQAKIQKLEAENNLLIDGIGIIAPFETTIDHYMHVQDALAVPQQQQQQLPQDGGADPTLQPESVQNHEGRPVMPPPPNQQTNGTHGHSRSYKITANMMDGQ